MVLTNILSISEFYNLFQQSSQALLIRGVSAPFCESSETLWSCLNSPSPRLSFILTSKEYFVMFEIHATLSHVSDDAGCWVERTEQTKNFRDISKNISCNYCQHHRATLYQKISLSKIIKDIFKIVLWSTWMNHSLYAVVFDNESGWVESSRGACQQNINIFTCKQLLTWEYLLSLCH